MLRHLSWLDHGCWIWIYAKHCLPCYWIKKKKHIFFYLFILVWLKWSTGCFWLIGFLSLFIRTWSYFIYTIWPKLCAHLPITPVWACWMSRSKTMDISMELVPSFVAIKSLHSSAKAYCNILECEWGDLCLFFTHAVM